MKRLVSVSLVLASALALSASIALAGGGNSAQAKSCQKGGWTEWVRADQTPFTNQGNCVSYAAQGGTLTSPGSDDTGAE
jgi:hypothetical protein